VSIDTDEWRASAAAWYGISVTVAITRRRLLCDKDRSRYGTYVEAWRRRDDECLCVAWLALAADAALCGA